MIGRQVIHTNRAFTLEELYQFMQEHWDTEKYNSFVMGAPTDMSLDMYILLPATPRYLVIVFARAANGKRRRENKVILSVANTPSGIAESFARSIPTQSILTGVWKISNQMSSEKERKGPAEEALQAYTAYMRELLQAAGYID
ncbi:MAG: hypothetical protein IKD96_02795 [Oscillospiraceae bacterium]|nr:hypothetical protein [Oscillospiraceae bacterium]